MSLLYNSKIMRIRIKEIQKHFYLSCQSLTMQSPVILTLTLFISVVRSREIVTTIEPSYGPDWGEWNGGVLCPDNTFAHG